MQEFDGQAAYAPFQEAAFKQRLTLATPHELDLMQQMLDWREGEIHNEIRLLDAAEDDSQGKCQPIKLCYIAMGTLVHEWCIIPFLYPHDL